MTDSAHVLRLIDELPAESQQRVRTLAEHLREYVAEDEVMELALAQVLAELKDRGTNASPTP